MMVSLGAFATIAITLTVHVCAQEEDVDAILPERLERSMPKQYVPSDLALRFGKRSWNGDAKRKIDYNDLTLRFGKRSSYVFDPSNLNLRFGKRFSPEGYQFKRMFVVPDDLTLRFGRR